MVKRKSTSPKPRPKLTKVRAEMERLRDNLKVIVVQGEDKEGKLSAKQLERAKQTKAALDSALKSVKCIQALSAY